MNLLKCANGHFFDADKFSQCPHCADLEKHDFTVTVPMDVNILGGNDGKTEALSITIPEDSGSQDKIVPQENDWQPAVPVTPVDEVTVGYYQDLLQRDPVVGFLVCTKGEYFGESFTLKSGRNFIGRASTMDVVLDMDPAVSRERHAIIVYEPRGRVFFAQSGDSHGMFYVNDNVVLSNQQLKSYDRISLGNTELLFIPCCGPEFSWEDINK